MEEKTIKVWPLFGMVVAVVVSIISVFLPLYTYASEGRSSLIEDSGGDLGRMTIIIAVIIGIAAVLTLVTKKPALSKLAGVVSILGGLAIAGIGGIAVFAVNTLNMSIASGVYLVFVGAAMFFILGIASMKSKKKS
ncbi:hypothetical protein [Enterococcus larvae]|uniref:hypothetical protein n=1 Tax=Enterococcus larvae TaxID=2794352 RepID=UPI003F3CCFC8